MQQILDLFTESVKPIGNQKSKHVHIMWKKTQSINTVLRSARDVCLKQQQKFLLNKQNANFTNSNFSQQNL